MADKTALKKDEAFAVAELIDLDLIDYIKRDPDIDSMQWLVNIVHAYEKLCDYGGYQGPSESYGGADDN